MTKPQDIQVGEIRELNLREIFPREDTSFTPWLSMPQNLARLSSAVGFELEVLDTEVRSKTFRVDILARRTMDDALVIIENQFERSDHNHLGQTLTYLAAHEAKTVIWIAERFADEHRQAMEWLNDNTSDEFSFFAVVPRLIQIGDSQPGLRFELEVKPNHTVKRIRNADRQLRSETFDIRSKVWSLVQEIAEEFFPDCSTRYGGRLGHLWIIPPTPPVFNGREVHILLYLSLPKDGPQRLYHFFSFGQDLGSEPSEESLAFGRRVWHRTLKASSDSGTELGSIPSNKDASKAYSAFFEGDLHNPTIVTQTVNATLKAASIVYQELQAEIRTLNQVGRINEHTS
jgi:hypothetical protein